MRARVKISDMPQGLEAIFHRCRLALLIASFLALPARAVVEAPVAAAVTMVCAESLSDVALRYARQRLRIHVVNDGRRVEEFRSESNDIEDLHPTIVSALEMANRRFTETRPDVDPRLVFERQKKVDGPNTNYFVLRGDEGRVTGLGLLVDGTTGARVPVEKEFPHIDFRRRPGEREPVELMEVARLATESQERGGLRHVFAAMAARLEARYGSRERIPANLRIVLWTSVETLTGVYRDKYGFDVWETPESLDRPNRWAMGMTAADFVARYGR